MSVGFEFEKAKQDIGYREYIHNSKWHYIGRNLQCQKPYHTFFAGGQALEPPTPSAIYIFQLRDHTSAGNGENTNPCSVMISSHFDFWPFVNGVMPFSILKVIHATVPSYTVVNHIHFFPVFGTSTCLYQHFQCLSFTPSADFAF